MNPPAFACFLSISMTALSAMSPSLAQAGEKALTDGLSVSFKTDWSRERQRQTSEASASTTKGVKQTFTISRALQADRSAGVDFTHTDLRQVTDRFAPGFSEAGTLKRDSFEANAFFEFQHMGVTVKPSVRLGFDDYQLSRPDTLVTGSFPGFGQMARAKSSGFHAGANLEVSAILPLSGSLFLRPIADIDYSYLTVKPFSETGATVTLSGYGTVSGNAAFDRVVDERVTSQIGAAVAARLAVSDEFLLTPFLQARYRHNFNTAPISTHAALIANPAMEQEAVLAVAEEADGLILDAGAFLAGAGNWEVLAVYEGKFFPSLTGQTFSGRLRMSF